MKEAVIGIGSNSLRMLTVDITAGRMERLARDREANRLFAGLDRNGNLTPESMDMTVKKVVAMAEKARAAGAERIDLFATSATRDAGNRQLLASLIREKTGLELLVCSGEEEAELSFIGASEGADCAVIDIGGGSTELVTGTGGRIRSALSCQMGAVRLSGMYPLNGTEDLAVVTDRAEEILERELALHPMACVPETWIGTGGTFTCLAAVLLDVHWTDRTYVHGMLLERDRIMETAEKLAVMTKEERLKLPSMQPGRADIVVHGIAILLSVMRHFSIRTVRVSEYGNLEGWFLRRLNKKAAGGRKQDNTDA